MDRTDQELIAAYFGGDRQSLDILIARHYRAIWAFTRRMTAADEDAEDITQDAFVKAWRHLKKFDREKNFKTWLCAIARNTAFDFFKKKKAVPFSAFENNAGENLLLETLTDPNPIAEEMLIQKETGAVIKKLLAQLSPKRRATLALRYTENMTFRAVAERMDEPLHTVKSRNRRVLAALRKIFPHA